MRVVALTESALVLTSRLWQTNAVAIRAGGEAMVIDSPYFPDELEALPAVLAQAGFEPDGLLATHGDFDHLMAPLAFPHLALGVAESTLLAVRAEPGAAQRDLRDHDDEHYVAREGPLRLGKLQSLPVPGKLEIGSSGSEIELHPGEGHTGDGMALLWEGVLIPGDYLSDVEIPMISPGGSAAEYRSTLDRLDRLIERAETVVPGHGAPLDREAAGRVLAEDAAYLDGLEAGGEVKLPKGRDSVRQRRIHAENVARCTGSAGA